MNKGKWQTNIFRLSTLQLKIDIEAIMYGYMLFNKIE